jgi:tRNA-Thr(GGU) m(6)t(6)A37 methyltransferase TsaA
MKHERKIELRPIGVIHSPFKECKDMPIQPAMAQGVTGSIHVFDEFAAGLKDLAGFDRIWLLFWFHRAGPVQMSVVPYLDSQKRGLFATRAPARPNPIGLSHVRLLAVEGSILRVADLDVLDGTPLLDIKPYVPRFDCFEVTRCGWLDTVTMRNRVADDRFERKKQKKKRQHETPNPRNRLRQVQRIDDGRRKGRAIARPAI